MEAHFYILDNEQPTWCPKCGARTDFEQYELEGELVQEHVCLAEKCGFKFLGVFESEEETY